MSSFLDMAEKRSNYADCLSEVINYLDRHSETIKKYRLNNMNGLKKILNAFIQNVDFFIEEGEDIELSVMSDGEIIKSR